MKMAEKLTIHVAVLEGTFACLSELGIPLLACIQMQSMGLKLGEAQWTARSTNTGFSVSFFWPTGWKSTTRHVRKRKKRKAKYTSPDRVAGDTVFQQQRVVGVQPSAEHDILIDAHSESMSTAHDSQKPLGQSSDPTTRGSTVDLKESREPIPTTSATLRPEDWAVESDSLLYFPRQSQPRRLQLCCF